MSKVKNPLSIWELAIGYFLFYIPYAGLAKAVTSGVYSQGQKPTGFELLPSIGIATTACFLLFIWLRGGFAHIGRRQWMGLNIPFPRAATLISGLATALIIGTTTLSYTFAGVSIVLALLLMRGGVLFMAPLTDLTCGRKISGTALAGWTLCAAAIALPLMDNKSYAMTWACAFNLGGYLLGYFVRFQFMTRAAKSPDREVTSRYFYEEMFVAAIALTLVPAIFAVIGVGPAAHGLRAGFTTFLTSNLVGHGLLIGGFYASLYLFGTLIYLQPKENTYCVPFNRCASLISGVVAAYALNVIAGMPKPGTSQLYGVGLLCLAFLTLSAPAILAKWRVEGIPVLAAPATRMYLFICSGNTSRSPMAQAFCTAELARYFDVTPEGLARLGIRAASAGLKSNPGSPMTEQSQKILSLLNVPAPQHASNDVTQAQVEEASAIYCMTNAQCEALGAQFPRAKAKIQRLDPERDIDDPRNAPWEDYLRIGKEIHAAVARRFGNPTLQAA